MKRILALLALLIATPAIAADNLAVTPGAGASVKMRDSTGAGGPLVSYIIPADLTGTSVWGTAGSANANILTVQGIASMTALTVAQATAANLNATVTQGAAGASPWLVTLSGTNNINNIAGTVSLPTGASTSALQPTNAAIASTTAAQTGHLVMGAVTTGSPTYTTAQTNPLSLDTTGALRVNVTAGGGAGGTSSTFGSAFPGTGTGIGFTDGTNMVAGRVTTYGTAPTGFNALAVNAFVTNTNANGQTTMSASSPVTIASDQSAVAVKSTAAATGGATTTSNIPPNNTTAVVIKASAGTLYGVQLSGIGSVPAYLKIYNSTSTCAGTPIKRFIIPAAATAANGAGSNITFGPQGVAFGTGITYCVSTDITDTNSGAPAANSYYVNIDWN